MRILVRPLTRRDGGAVGEGVAYVYWEMWEALVKVTKKVATQVLPVKGKRSADWFHEELGIPLRNGTFYCCLGSFQCR